MAATKQDREARDGHEPGDAGSSVSGARRITHEIDTEYGTGRTASAVLARPALDGFEPRPSHVPTLPAPTLARPARSRSSTRKAVDPWDFATAAEPSWLGSHVEGLLEALDAAPVVVESTLSADELVAIAVEALGGLRRIPRVTLAQRALGGLRLSQREAFVLSLVDGAACVEDIVDMSALPELEALRILVELCRREILRCG